MLNLLDESLEAFLRAEVPLPSKNVDVSFEAPDSDWGAGVTKPTLNLYLWDLRLNFDERQEPLCRCRKPARGYLAWWGLFQTRPTSLLSR